MKNFNTTLKKVHSFLRNIPDDVPINYIITASFKGDIEWPYRIDLYDVVHYLRYNNGKMP